MKNRQPSLMVHTNPKFEKFEFDSRLGIDQHLGSHKHVINIIMGFRDMGCYNNFLGILFQLVVGELVQLGYFIEYDLLWMSDRSTLTSMVSLGSYNHYCTNHKNLFHLIDQKETAAGDQCVSNC
jgi:hypothetical protein